MVRSRAMELMFGIYVADCLIRILCSALVYLRPRYLQYRSDEAKRRKREEQLAATSPITETAPTSYDDSSPPVRASQKTVLQAISDAFRDGAVDEEEELVYVESLDQPDSPIDSIEAPVEVAKRQSRLWSFRASRKSDRVQTPHGQLIEESPTGSDGRID